MIRRGLKIKCKKTRWLLTYAVARGIFGPPDPPTARTTSPLSSVITVGHMEDIGRLYGCMKFVGDGGNPWKFVTPGMEKSFI